MGTPPPARPEVCRRCGHIKPAHSVFRTDGTRKGTSLRPGPCAFAEEGGTFTDGVKSYPAMVKCVCPSYLPPTAEGGDR